MKIVSVGKKSETVSTDQCIDTFDMEKRYEHLLRHFGEFPGDSGKKNLPANAGDMGDADSVPGLGRSPGGGNGNPLQ